MNRPLYLGLTGPFGSGCTTIMNQVLEKDPYFFKCFSLSNFVKQTWLDRNPGKDITNTPRKELQDIGDELRQNGKESVLAEYVVNKAKETTGPKDSIVFDSIRNVAEVDYLRRSYHDFYLIGVCCSESNRWERVKSDYEKQTLQLKNFKEDEQRDQNEEGRSSGQQVALCMYEADILIVNDNLPMVNQTAAVHTLKEKLGGYIDIFNGKLRSPTEFESYMSIAYDASLMSRCHKRQVGAVLVHSSGAIISVGWNANPKPMKSCVDEFGDCYRVLRVEEQLNSMKSCPLCFKAFDIELRYPYACPHCGQDVYKGLFRDRALSKCTALHAEEMAILNAGQRTLDGYTLYTTTFPCFTCAQKIIYAGIKQIIYVESYPDLDSIELFNKVEKTGEVKLHKFEGIKARAYHRSFGSWRKAVEDSIIQKKHS
jgi:deoxycytidylate deaminase